MQFPITRQTIQSNSPCETPACYHGDAPFMLSTRVHYIGNLIIKSFQDSDWLKSSKTRFFFLTLLALWPCLFLVNGSVGGPYCLLIEATLEPHSVRCGWWACPKARFSSSPGLFERCLHVLPVHLCVSGRGVGGIHVSGLGLSRYQNFSIRYQYMWISTILDTYPIRWQNLKTEPMYFKKNSF